MGNYIGDRDGAANNPVGAIVAVAAMGALAYASGSVGRAAAEVGAALQSSGILLAPDSGMVEVGPLGSLDLPRTVAAVLVVVVGVIVVRAALRNRATERARQRER